MNVNERNYIFDEPVKYKELVLYPVRLKDYMSFLYLSTCLMIEKNSIKDPEMAVKAISLSYLEYMYTLSMKNGTFVENEITYQTLFDGLLRLVIDEKDALIKCGFENKKPYFKINDVGYDSDDFMKIREIIAEQNKLDLPDERIQKDVRDAMEEAQKFKQKLNKTKTANFEEQLLALSIYTGWDLNYIYNMTVRKFILSIQRANHMIMSNIYLTASMSGFVTFKDKSILRGWLADITQEDKYADVKMDIDSVKNKVSGNEAKNK